jgi:transposase InsO family protein
MIETRNQAISLHLRHDAMSGFQGVMVHPDQGRQFTSSDWQSFLKAHRMVPSMSRRGNRHDNAVVESFFSVLKKERIKRRIYPTRVTAASDVLDYIEMFYNPIRRHGSAGGVSSASSRGATRTAATERLRNQGRSRRGCRLRRIQLKGCACLGLIRISAHPAPITMNDNAT